MALDTAMAPTHLFSSRKIIFILCALMLIVSALFLASSRTNYSVFKMSSEKAAGTHNLIDLRQQDLDLDTNDKLPQPVSPKNEKSQPAYRDVVNNSGGKALLMNYKKLFGNSSSVPGNPNIPDTITTWWQAAAMIEWYINSPIRHKCKNLKPAGNWHVCQDEPYAVQPPCLVYSFGINWDFSFDDAMGKLGCEVHSFDPSMDTADHKRSAQVTFHNMGLGSEDIDSFDPRKDDYIKKPQKWKMRTLKSAMKELGHEGRVLDVLKIDIEGHEWKVIENMFDTDMFKYIRQFELEFHLFPDWPAKKEYVHLYQLWTKLRESGFREYNIGPHPQTRDINKFNLQGDNEYVNIFFKPPAAGKS